MNLKSFDHTDNDDEIVGTILSRREALAAAARAGFGLVLAGTSAAAMAELTQGAPKVHLVATPMLEEGPFFVDEKLNRSNLLTGTTRASVVDGLPFVLELQVFSLKNGSLSALPGVHVDIWHTDASGVYSDESNPMNHEDTSRQTWLRGYQVTDVKGNAKFHTIFPGWYESRTTHIHVKVRRFSEAHNVTAQFTSQLFFEDSLSDSVFSKPPYNGRGHRRVTNQNDGVFGNRQVDGSLAGTHLTLSPTKSHEVLTAKFAIALTAGNFNMEGGGFRGGPPRDWF